MDFIGIFLVNQIYKATYVVRMRMRSGLGSSYV